jgi:pimeloyl-ACP methyl ester carboxylesterase
MKTRTPRIPSIMVRVVVATTTLVTMMGAFTATPIARATEQPTIVLVHGAFADPSSWSDVMSRLEKAGYETLTPRLDLDSVAGDVAIVRAALDAIDGDALLVGHSYGGFVISNAAAGRTDVRGLVYTAAYVPAPGESVFSVSEGWAPPAFLAPGHLQVLPPTFTSAIIDPRSFGRTSRRT